MKMPYCFLITNKLCLSEKMKKTIFLIISIVVLCSCGNKREHEIISLLKKWNNKEIIFPNDAIFTICGRDTVPMPVSKDFKVISFVDSTGCTSCKLKLDEWKHFISMVDSTCSRDVAFLFYLNPKNVLELKFLFERYNFEYPVCIDVHNVFCQLNSLPELTEFQTFLLDQENKVVAIGNPIHNPKIKELYLKIIQGQPIEEEKETIKTQVTLPETSFIFGDFSWQEAQTHSFEVKNTGNKPLVIQDVTTSCGCITVDFTKEPVQPGGTATVKVTYKADRAEYFNKTVTIYGNAEQLPVQLHVAGNAK